MRSNTRKGMSGQEIVDLHCNRLVRESRMRLVEPEPWERAIRGPEPESRVPHGAGVILAVLASMAFWVIIFVGMWLWSAY